MVRPTIPASQRVGTLETKRLVKRERVEKRERKKQIAGAIKERKFDARLQKARGRKGVGSKLLSGLFSQRRSPRPKKVKFIDPRIERKRISNVLNTRREQTLMRIINSVGASPVAKARARRLLGI